MKGFYPVAVKVSIVGQPDAPDLGVHLRYVQSLNLPFVQKNRHQGDKALIVSTGNTLMNKGVQRQIKSLAKTHEVFALKESIPFLKDRLGVKPKYSVAMDPSGDRQVERTPIDPDVIYCLATSCHPKLFDHLLSHDCEVQVFHSACGYSRNFYQPGMQINCGDGQEDFAIVKGEFELESVSGGKFSPLVLMFQNETQIYHEWFDGQADVMCGGYTVTNRALALAHYMGFEFPIQLAAADFGWRKEGDHHYCPLVTVKPSSKQYMTDSGGIDGKPWFTAADQLASAVDIAYKIRQGEVVALGDTLAAALAKRDEEYLSKVVKLT